MIKVLKLFFGAEGTRPYLVLGCLLLAALSEAVGIGTLLPALSTLTGSQASSSPVTTADFRLPSPILGITPNIGNFIIVIVVALVLKSVLGFRRPRLYRLDGGTARHQAARWPFRRLVPRPLELLCRQEARRHRQCDQQ